MQTSALLFAINWLFEFVMLAFIFKLTDGL